MKTFNIDEALKGKKVVTRSGIEITQLTWFDCRDKKPVVGVCDDEIHTWGTDGTFFTDGSESVFDLFMDTQTVSVWIARFGTVFSPAYPSLEKAKEFCPNADGYHKITWEE